MPSEFATGERHLSEPGPALPLTTAIGANILTLMSEIYRNFTIIIIIAVAPVLGHRERVTPLVDVCR